MNAFMATYLEIEEKQSKHKDIIEQRDKVYKKECLLLFTKLHKFLSHFISNAHKEIISSIDENLAEWEQLKNELTSL